MTDKTNRQVVAFRVVPGHGLEVDYHLDTCYDIPLSGDMLVGAIATLNAVLPDSDPRKITREMVERLRAVARDLLPKERTLVEGSYLDGFADALESYLPPE